MTTFVDRRDAGRQLAAALRTFRDPVPIVLGLPRGGVPVAFEVARQLDAPLDVIVIRKLGVPTQPELAMGAIGEEGARVINDEVVRATGVTAKELTRVETVERVELARRAALLRGGRPPASLVGRTALIVDDGIATGSTAQAACEVARARGAARVVVAAPVAPQGTARRFEGCADEVVVLCTPEEFFAVGQFYDDFSPVPDDDVVRILDRAGELLPAGIDDEVAIPVGAVTLAGHLAVPAGARGLVVFAHGSGSSRHSPRNRFVAGILNDAGIGTLLFDLLVPEEELDRSNVFDVQLLAGRLQRATSFLRGRPELAHLPVGYFGASTGAAAALTAAADADNEVAAVVSRGGRPDLAGPALSRVTAPTLLLVGDRDEPVLGLNRDAAQRLSGVATVALVEGATHLFEEPGTLRAAAEAARDWFLQHLVVPGSS